MNKNSLIILIIDIFCLLSCSSGDRNNKKSDFIPDVITFSKSLKYLSDGDLIELEYAMGKLLENKKIVSIVDGVCMKCVINDLNDADLAFQELVGKGNQSQVVFILNVPPTDSLYFRTFFEPMIDVKGIILWDSSYDFEKLNKLLSPDKKNRTFLLDEENQIMLFGSPQFDQKLNEQYKEIIHGK